MNGPPQGLRQSILYLNSYLAEHPALWIAAIVLGILALAVLSSVVVGHARSHH